MTLRELVFPSELALLLVILLPLLAGTSLAALAGRRSARAAAWTLAAVVAAALAIVLALAPRVFGGLPVTASWSWIPALGLGVSLRLDGLGLLFALLVLGIGLLVILYARYYLGPADPPGKFYGRLAFFMAAMLGVVLADNLLFLAVCWELTSLASFLLIGYWQHREEARLGARTALVVTGAGGLCLLAGFLLLGHLAGSHEIGAIVAVADRVRADAWYPVILVLILVGAFTKSAQVPFHFWLPEAMAAPTPVSAYLHSATLVKAGIFLLSRLYPVLGGTPLFMTLVSTAGLVTFVLGAYVAVFRHDLKGLLAYSTLSHLGLIAFLIGLDSPLSNVAAVFHIGNHATFKASLFMAAGIIEHETGTRDMRRLGGLARYMPYTAALAIVAASAMAGVPLLNGFLSKEMFFTEALALRHLGPLGALAAGAVALGGAFSVAYSARFVHDVFFNGEPRDLPRAPHEAPRFMKVPVEILVATCVAVGTLPALTVGPLVDLAARSVFGADLPPYSVSLWHGLTPSLLVSALAFAAGAVLYWALQHQYNLHLHAPHDWTARRVYHTALARLTHLAERVTAALDTGSLRRSLVLLVLAALAVGATSLLGHGVLLGDRAPLRITPLDVVGAALMAAAAVGCAVWHRRRFLAILLTSAVGLGVAVSFLVFSAPDLAFTQLTVEVVSTLLLLLALARLPAAGPRLAGRPRRMGDAVLAAVAGLGIAGIAAAVLTRPLETISWYFLEQSVPGAGGRNAVNTILVDFRGFDTFGEITVLTIAALGVAAVLDGVRLGRRENAVARGWPVPLLLLVAARWLLPLALVVSLYIFLRGHDSPGGGFVAGLITAIALVLQYVARGTAWVSARLRVDYARLAAGGLLVAGATGVGAWAFGAPFLTSAHGTPVVPGLGPVPLTSAALFDLGVYLVVVGTVLLTLLALHGAGREAPE